MKTKKLYLPLILLCLVLLTTCKKYYEDGPFISFRTKMNRITGKWKLVEMEAMERLNPHIDQYIELTKEKVDEEKYKAVFTNFQEEYCEEEDTLRQQALFNAFGMWEFTGGDWQCKGPSEQDNLFDKQALFLTYENFEDEKGKSVITTKVKWKILRLTNRELIIVNKTCVFDRFYTPEICDLRTRRILTFEKI
jgi:hypothetical protein